MTRCAGFAAVFAALLLGMTTGALANPATETEHTVEEGETMNGIANRAGVSASVIAAANGISEPYVVKLGQKLVIPRQRTHVVKEGETGLGLANRYGVPFSAIKTANKLAVDGSIRVGQKLIIPAVMPETKLARRALPATGARTPDFRAPHDGDLLYTYRYRAADNAGHEGFDYAVDPGDMVRASASGRVIFAGDEPVRFGKMVIISHGAGWHTVYGHMTDVTVKRGEQVRQGERIGIAGQGGKAERPELHFEIRKNRKPVDPAPLVHD